MRIIYGKQELRDVERAQENCWLVTNGRGGYSSLSLSYSVTRGDQGALIRAAVAPTVRDLLVQRMREYAVTEDGPVWFSTQDFTDPEQTEEDGYRRQTSFVWEDEPRWLYEDRGVTVERSLFMMPGENTTCVAYRIENQSKAMIRFCAEPGFVGLPKGQVPDAPFAYRLEDGILMREGEDSPAIHIRSNGSLREFPAEWDVLRYRDDENEGRNKTGRNLRCLRIEMEIPAGESREMEVLLSDGLILRDGASVREAYRAERSAWRERISLKDPAARQLAMAAADYVVRRDSTGGSTIVAGYPFFADWGRDTMIALEGCVMVPNRMDTAEEIIETFLKYEKNGLVPNLFPEGGAEPRYNTVDAALLLINSVWSCYRRTGNADFVRRVYPAMKRIIEGYRRGTDHGIHMDSDGLICAGEGLDQVTWMDVCVNGILPTPRHGKPVEVNAYWYNGLKVMATLAPLCGEAGEEYEDMASRAKDAFAEKFPMAEEGCLKDVLSDTAADTQIRCNQIWAVTMPFSLLSEEQEREIVETVYRELYTPCGLRTLSPRDPQFHPNYGGEQLERDLAYHQGTVWVFPLGAFYRAWLKVHKYSDEAKDWVRERLLCLEPMLREGCVGQLPEIYDGLAPGTSKGCFAQAWSVGELLTVYELLEK